MRVVRTDSYINIDKQHVDSLQMTLWDLPMNLGLLYLEVPNLKHPYPYPCLNAFQLFESAFTYHQLQETIS